MITNGAPISSESSQIALIPGTGTAVPSSAAITRASRTTSLAPGGMGGRGGRRSTASQPWRRSRKVALECPPGRAITSAGPEPMPCSSR